VAALERCHAEGLRARDETEEGQLWGAETDGEVFVVVPT
jgi:hypothetical protein